LGNFGDSGTYTLAIKCGEGVRDIPVTAVGSGDYRR